MENPESESVAVRNLQTYLRQISYHESEITPPPIDGIFGSDTRRSLSEFQRSRGLPVTGTADKRTWDALYAAYRASLAANALPERVALFPLLPENYSFCKDCRGFAISALQYMLWELQHRYGEAHPVEITGIYDDATEAAVRRFQEQNALLPNGNTDRATWNAITGQYNMLIESEQVQ